MTVRKYRGGESEKYHLPIFDLNDYNNDGLYDDQFSATIEQRHAHTVENNVWGAMGLFRTNNQLIRRKGVLSEGEYYFTYQEDSEGNITDLADATIENFEGFINGVYISEKFLTWENLTINQEYHLFIRLIEQRRDDEALAEQNWGYQSSVQFMDVEAFTKDNSTEKSGELLIAIGTPPLPNKVFGIGKYGVGPFSS